MAAPIIAAYNPYTEDRAPVVLAQAAARLTGSEVIAAAVHPWEVLEELPAPEPFSEEIGDTVLQSMHRLREDVGVHTHFVTDLSVARGLQRFADELHAGLLVVGSTDRGRAGRVLAGSTADRLLHGAPCPVALAPRGYTPSSVETIAVGFVDSPEGHEALVAAHALAKRAGARLRVIAALHPAGGFDAALTGDLRPQRGAMLQGRHRIEVEAAVGRALESLDDGVDVEREFHVDDPATVLLKISEHVDLLVCGSRGYGPRRSVLLGGVSRRLVDGSRCPVLVLPRDADRPLERLFDSADSATVG